MLVYIHTYANLVFLCKYIHHLRKRISEEQIYLHHEYQRLPLSNANEQLFIASN